MRDLRVHVVCAVHGAMVGGAAAIFLHTDLRVAEREATFQHGNLSRGVCPVAGYSRTLQAAIGTPHAYGYYVLDNAKSAALALMLGLVHAVRTGVHSAKESARQLVGYEWPQGQAVPAARCTIDLRLLEEEAIAHMECQHVNGGFIYTSQIPRVPSVSLPPLVLTTTANMPARWRSVWLTRVNTQFDGSSLELPFRVLPTAHACPA